MGLNSLRLLDWQLYWKKWHLGKDTYKDTEFDIEYIYIFIGPLQLKFVVDKPRR